MAGLSKDSFGLRALHSLSGVFPVGLFMLLQVWAHAKALDGAEAHGEALAAVHPSHLSTQLLIGVPLVFHAVYGLVLAYRSRYNLGGYPTSGNWSHVLVRFTGVIALVLIVWTMAILWGTPTVELAPRITAKLSQTHQGLPLIALAYFVGLGACVFHFIAGLYTLCRRYGFVASPSGTTQLGMAMTVVGLALFAWSGHTLLFIATGWQAMGVPRVDTANVVCDPATIPTAVEASSAVIRHYPVMPAPPRASASAKVPPRPEKAK